MEYETARKIINIYIKEKRVDKKKTGKMVNEKITPGIENFVESEIENNSQITIVQQKTKISENLNVNICNETVRRCIYKLKITLKVALRTLENVNSAISEGG